MSFVAFENAIISAPLIQVARLWNEARGSRTMPNWSDIRPSRITAQLPIIWAYRYDRSTDTFIGRLAGDRIEHVFGKTFRGTPMSDLYPADGYPTMRDHFRRVVCEPVLHLQIGMVFKFVDHFGYGERIIMPLSTNGELGDGIFGATTYETFSVAQAQPHPDSEYWFPL